MFRYVYLQSTDGEFSKNGEYSVDERHGHISSNTEFSSDEENIATFRKVSVECFCWCVSSPYPLPISIFAIVSSLINRLISNDFLYCDISYVDKS